MGTEVEGVKMEPIKILITDLDRYSDEELIRLSELVEMVLGWDSVNGVWEVEIWFSALRIVLTGSFSNTLSISSKGCSPPMISIQTSCVAAPMSFDPAPSSVNNLAQQRSRS